MFFKKAIFENFMSFKSEEFNYKSSDLLLVKGNNQDEGGSNGAGKTSMITDTISWAFFGKTVRGLKGDDVIHRKFKKDCFVYINVDFDGKDIWVKRHRKHKEFGDRLWLEIDGKTKEFGTMAQTEAYIESFFGIDFELFRCTVVFAQEETFNFINSGNKSQKDILGKIMRIAFDQYLAKAKTSLKEFKTGKDAFEKQLAILRSHIVDGDSVLKEEIDQWEEEHQADCKRLYVELVEEKKKIDEKQSELEESIDLTEFESKKTELINRKAELTAQKSVHESKIKELKNKTKNSEEVFKASECPSCLRPVDGLDFAERLKEIDSHITEEQEQVDDISARIEGVNKKIHNNMEKINEAILHNSSMEKLNTQIKILKSRFKDKKERLVEKKKEINPYLKQREEVIAKQAQIKDKIKKIEGDLNEINEIIPYYSFWELGFGDSGIKSFIFDLVCSSLTTKTNKYLNTLTNGSVAISFDTQQKTKKGDLKEKFDCEVITDGERVKYEAYSGGEKRRISLAVDMALSSLMQDYYGSKFNIVVFDEQTNFMDKDGRLSYMNLLKEISIDRGTYVVDHDDEFKTMFDNVITVVKKDKISKVVYEK